MPTQRHVLMSAIAGAALIASSMAPASPFGTPAQAQEGKGFGGSTRTEQPARANPPSGTKSPTINRSPALGSTARSEKSRQGRTFGQSGSRTTNRVIVRDGDRRRGTRYVWGPGLAFYYYDGFYHGDCSWLRRKARETGSRYWRQRYEQCRD